MKKAITILLALLVFAAVLSGCENTAGANGNSYSQDVTELDLSGGKLPDLEEIAQLQQLKKLDLRGTGVTAEQYEQLRAALPGCEILWEVPFQGNYLALDTKEISVAAITEQDMALLSYLTSLEKIDATACTDLEAVMALKAMYPEVEVRYQVSLNGQLLAGDTTALTLESPDISQLTAQLNYLPDVTDVTLAGNIPEKESMYELKQTYPEIQFHWEFELFGQTVSADAAEIDLSGIPMESVEELENGLKYFNDLQKVVMCDTGLPSEEIDNLWKRHPETRFIWNVKIGDCDLRTDTTAFIPYTFGYTGVASDPDEKLYEDDFAEMKYLVDMICMDLGHMRPGNISFVSYMPNLEYLLLCDTGIRDITPLENCKKLKYLELFSNNISDFSPLAGCTALEDVNLCFNPIKEISSLYGLENLKNIWITGFHLTSDQRQALEESNPDARIVYATSHAVSSGWRELPNYYAQRDLLGMFYMEDDA